MKKVDTLQTRNEISSNGKFDFISFCVISALVLLTALPAFHVLLQRMNKVAVLPTIPSTAAKIAMPPVIAPIIDEANNIAPPPDKNSAPETVTPPRINTPPIQSTDATHPPEFRLADTYSFRQNDMIWGGQTIGETTQSLFNYGCTITSVAMASSNLMQTKITPSDVEASLQQHGGFTKSGLLIWDRLQPATNGRVRAIVAAKANHNSIQKCAAKDGYPVVKIKLSNGIIHWVLIVGSAEQDYLIRDPLVGGPNDAPIWLSQRSDNIYALRCLVLTDEG